MRIAALLLLTSPAWATAYTAVGTNPYQLWGIASVWSPVGVPGDGDTVNIPDGTTVTLNQVVTIGASLPKYLGPHRGPQSAVAVSLNNSGRLIIYQGGVLISRGDIVYTPADCTNTTNALLMTAGATLEFDSSTAPSPSTTHYSFGPNGNNGCRGFWSNGIATLRNTVFSNPAGGAGQFSLRGNTGTSGSFVASYTDFQNIGDASNPGWVVNYDYYSDNIQWNVTYSTFTNCGEITQTTGPGVNTNSIFQHSYNVHTKTAGNEIFGAWTNIRAIGTGTREVRNNVFDAPFSLSYFQPYGFTFWSNYFGDVALFGGIAQEWTSFQGNFYHEPSNSKLGGTIQLEGDALDNYWVLDEPLSNNPHGPQTYDGGNSTISGNIIDETGDLVASLSCWWITSENSPGNQAITYNIMLPNAVGQQGAWLTLLDYLGNAQQVTVEHNTWPINNLPGTGGGILTRHPTTQPTPAGMLASYRSNILWNWDRTNDYYKLFEYPGGGFPGGPNPNNVCDPAACDYNDGYNTLTDGMGFSGGGNGYADNFTSTPGQHDLAVNPMFLDATRNMATFDSAYLHNTAPAWSSTATYSVGQAVSSSDPTLYATTALGFPSTGAVINYRYTNGSSSSYAGSATCSGANPKPGLYTAISRACWEWATLYDIRQAIGATTLNSGACPGNGAWSTIQQQCLWDDQTIGAHGVDIIQTLVQWVRAGYSPTNALLAGSAHDGTDIGAVPVSFPAPTANLFRGSASYVVLRPSPSRVPQKTKN